MLLFMMENNDSKEIISFYQPYYYTSSSIILKKMLYFSMHLIDRKLSSNISALLTLICSLLSSCLRTNGYIEVTSLPRLKNFSARVLNFRDISRRVDVFG